MPIQQLFLSNLQYVGGQHGRAGTEIKHLLHITRIPRVSFNVPYTIERLYHSANLHANGLKVRGAGLSRMTALITHEHAKYDDRSVLLSRIADVEISTIVLEVTQASSLRMLSSEVVIVITACFEDTI